MRRLLDGAPRQALQAEREAHLLAERGLRVVVEDDLVHGEIIRESVGARPEAPPAAAVRPRRRKNSIVLDTNTSADQRLHQIPASPSRSAEPIQAASGSASA